MNFHIMLIIGHKKFDAVGACDLGWGRVVGVGQGVKGAGSVGVTMGRR